MEEDTELPLTQCPDKSRRVWEPEWLMVLVNTFEPYQETFSRQKRDENGEARIFKEASELWAAFEEDFLTKMPMVRGYFTAKQPVKSKMLGLKEELKKTVEACGASGSGGNEKLAQPLFKRLMQMYQQDPLIVPKEFLDSHSTFCHHLWQCCSFGRVTAYKFAGMQLIFTCAAYVADAAREAVREVAGTRTAETGLQPIAPINPVGCKRNAQQALPHSYLLTSQRGILLPSHSFYSLALCSLALCSSPAMCKPVTAYKVSTNDCDDILSCKISHMRKCLCRWQSSSHSICRPPAHACKQKRSCCTCCAQLQ